MKKSLSIFLVAAAALIAAPAQAQFRHTTPKTDQQMKLADKVTEKKAKAADQTVAKKYAQKEFKTTIPVKTLQLGGAPVAAPVKKAPRRATTETFDTPWAVAMDSEADFNLFTVIDANGDGKEGSSYGKWIYYEGYSSNEIRYYYSSENTADDWLITPGLKLEGGKTYEITFSSTISTNYGEGERLEVKYGTAPDAASMTKEIMAVQNPGVGDHEYFFAPTADGTYYIGFHALSEPDQFYIAIKNLTVQISTKNINVPAIVTDIEITPNAEGKTQAKLSFTAPKVNIANLPLSSLTGVRILRSQLDEEGNASENEEVADVKRNAAPGATMTFSDIYMTDTTMYTYTFIPYNENGEGRATTASRWIGLDYPAAISSPVLTDVDGKGFKMTWDEPTGANNGAFFPEDVLYQVCTMSVEEGWFWNTYYPYSLIGEVTGKTEFTYSYPMDEDEDIWALQLGVVASNETGANWDYYDAPSNAVYIGAPYVTPFAESFPGKTLENDVWFSDGYQTYYGYYDYNTNIYFSEESVDGDGGSIDFRTGYAHEEEVDTMLLKTWKLSLAGTTKPQLAFMRKFVSQAAAPSAKILVKVITAEGDEVEVATKELTASDEDWVKESFDLSSFIDNRYIWLEFGLTQGEETSGTQDLFVDNIHVGDFYDIEGEVTLDAPESVLRGEDANIAVVVKNNGEKDLEGFKVNVTVGDEVVANYTVADKLASLGAKALNFKYTVDKLEQKSVLPVKVQLTVDGDLDATNNVAVAQIAVESLDLLPVEDLKLDATTTEGARILSWAAPEIGVAKEYTESFEKGFGGFTTIDADGDGYNWIHYTNTGENDLTVHSGNGVVYSESYSNALESALTPDNWLVTPAAVLDGTFKFWAAAQDADWSEEHFAVFASTESATDVDAFQQVSEEYVATADMTEYTVDLSNYAGANGWVAIRHFNSTDMFTLNIDDVTFLKTSAGGDIVNYNVYRNGKLLAQTPELTFTDKDTLADGEYTYQVTVTYETGEESAPIAVVYTQQTDGIMQVISNGQPFDIYTVDGKMVRQNATTLQGLNKGVYVINGKKVVK